MKCPYCDREMTKGRLQGDGRSAMRFIADGHKMGFGDFINGTGRINAEYSFGTLRIEAYYCDVCKKLIIDTDVKK